VYIFSCLPLLITVGVSSLHIKADWTCLYSYMAVRPVFRHCSHDQYLYLLFVLRPVKCLGQHLVFAGGCCKGLNTVVFQPLGVTLVKPMGNKEIQFK
jgi:hypothetical protein